MQPAHAGRHEAGPAAGAAAHVEAFGIGRQLIPGKDGEVVGKHALGFPGGHALLIEALPFIAEAGDGAGGEGFVDISWNWRGTGKGAALLNPVTIWPSCKLAVFQEEADQASEF